MVSVLCVHLWYVTNAQVSYTLLLENVESSHSLVGCGLLSLGCHCRATWYSGLHPGWIHWHCAYVELVVHRRGYVVEERSMQSWRQDTAKSDGVVPSRERQRVPLGNGVGQWGSMPLESRNGQFSPLDAWNSTIKCTDKEIRKTTCFF